MQWIKEFLIACGVVVAFACSWIVAVQIGDFPWDIHAAGNEWLSAGLGILLVGIGVAGFFLLPEPFKIVGGAIGLGAAIGVILPISIALETLFEHVRGFWPCLGVWFIYMIIASAGVGAGVMAAKNILYSLLRFDFVVTVFAFPIFVTGFYTAIGVFVAALEISTFMGIMLLLAFVGGASGIQAPAISSGEVLPLDDNGNFHFAITEDGAGHIIDTDGNTLRQRADGNYEKLH